MLLYSYNKVDKAAGGDPIQVTKIFRWLMNPRIPNHKREKDIIRWNRTDFSGLTFLVNPVGLFENEHKYKHNHIAEYLYYASMRNTAEYFASGKISLDAVLVPGSIEETRKCVEANPLLEMEEDQINFKYEDYST